MMENFNFYFNSLYIFPLIYFPLMESFDKNHHEHTHEKNSRVFYLYKAFMAPESASMTLVQSSMTDR